MLSIIQKNYDKHEVNEVLKLYSMSLKKTDAKRMSYLKKFLLFCIEKQITVSKVAIEEFLITRNLQQTTIKSYLNVFRKYCEQKGFVGYWYFLSESRYKGNHPYILRFLAQYDFKNEKTKKNYLSELNLFFSYMEENHISFGQILVQKYLQQGLANQLSVFTLNTRLSVIKAFTRWLLDQKDLISGTDEVQIVDSNKILAIKNFKTDKDRYYKESLSLKEREALLDSIESLEDKLIISLQAYEGLRASEICNLCVEDINLEANIIAVLGKGKYKKLKIRLFNTSKQLLEHIIFGRKEGSLFEGLTYHQVYHIVKKYLPNYSPHCLRHTAAQIMTEKNFNKDFIQKQMRHSNYQTTQIYTLRKIEETFLKEMPVEV